MAESNREMTMEDFTLSDFHYELPVERIAHEPVRPRDSARLLHIRPNGVADRWVRDLPSLLRRGDILVVNNTRVFPAQLSARRGDAGVGLTLDRPTDDGAWRALARNGRRLRVGDVLEIDGSDKLTALVISKGADGSVELRFNLAGEDLMMSLRSAGALALPPYIKRPEGPTVADASDYQTVFAERDGAVAAPTAGLHFTPDLLSALEAAGIVLTTVTLHVGIGTFLPVRVDRVRDHRMHAEWGEVSEVAAAKINAARSLGGRIVAIGTTSLRLLESAVSEDGTVHPFHGETSLFILPGYRFKAIDLLVTNFHLPRSTLLMLVSAFSGREQILSAYAHAIKAGYRFHSYGDACLLEPA